MSTSEQVLLIVPALDEERSVAGVVERARALGYDVCVVDDGSADRTAQRAGEAGAVVLRLPVNLGVGGALRCGFRWALDNGYDVVVQVDADGQHDPGQAALLLDAMRETGADMVVGSRFADGEGDYEVNSVRRLAIVRFPRASGASQVCASWTRAPVSGRYAARCWTASPPTTRSSISGTPSRRSSRRAAPAPASSSALCT